jgi:hypothetical protein
MRFLLPAFFAFALFLGAAPCDVQAQSKTVQEVQDDFNHLVTFSPWSLFTRWRYENVNDGHFSWGARAEFYGTGGGAFAALPYARAYTGTESEGFYLEAAGGPMLYFSDEYSPEPLQAQFRLGLGSQWMGGRKVIRPRDFSVSVNIDTFYINEVADASDEYSALLGILGPWSILKIRYQRGIGW